MVAMVGTMVEVRPGIVAKMARSDVARALGLQPGTYRLHVENGHSEPR